MTINSSFTELSWLHSFIKLYLKIVGGKKAKKKKIHVYQNIYMYTQDAWMDFLKRKNKRTTQV